MGDDSHWVRAPNGATICAASRQDGRRGSHRRRSHCRTHARWVSRSCGAAVAVVSIALTFLRGLIAWPDYSKLSKDIAGAFRFVYTKFCADGFPAVLAHPEEYMVKQTATREWLRRLRDECGVRLFALTNAGFDHANALMTYSYGEDWLTMFDVVVVEAKKRTLFSPEAQATASGSTLHLKPFLRLNKAGARQRAKRGDVVLPKLGQLYSGGNFPQLMDFFAANAKPGHDGYLTCKHGWTVPVAATSGNASASAAASAAAGAGAGAGAGATVGGQGVDPRVASLRNGTLPTADGSTPSARLAARMTCGKSMCVCGTASRPLDALGSKVSVCYFGDHVPQDVVLSHQRGLDVVAVVPDLLHPVDVLRSKKPAKFERPALPSSCKLVIRPLAAAARPRGASASFTGALPVGLDVEDSPPDPNRVPGWGSVLHATGVHGPGSEYGTSLGSLMCAPPTYVAHLWMGSAQLCVPSVAWLAATSPDPDIITDSQIAAALRLPSDVTSVVLPATVPPSLAARLCSKMPGGAASRPASGSRTGITTADAVIDGMGSPKSKKSVSARHPVSLPNNAPRKVVVAAANCLAGGVFTTGGSQRFFPVSRRASITQLPVVEVGSAEPTSGHGVGISRRGSPPASVDVIERTGVQPDLWGRWKWLAVCTATQVAMAASGDPLIDSNVDIDGAVDVNDFDGGSAASRMASSMRG